MALPAQAQVLGTGVLQVQEIGAQLFHATVTAVQSTISAVEDVIQTASALQELVPLDAILVAEGIAEDLAALADIVRQAEGLSYDIASLQAQIDALFNLDTAPMARRALQERLTEIRRVRVQAYTYAMRLQTLMTTALRTVDHLILLVNSIANFLGAKQGMQTLVQLNATISKTITIHATQQAAYERAGSIDKMDRTADVEASLPQDHRGPHGRLADEVTMTSGIFDDITRVFLATLEAGTLSLGAYSLPFLGAFALIGWYWNFGRSLALGGGEMGDALASALLYAVNIGVAYWLLVNLSGMATAAYQTFLQWGLAVGGGATAGLLLTPSAVVDLGFQIAKPLQDSANSLTGLFGIFYIREIFKMDLSAQIITWAFPLVALALMMTQIEYHLAVMLGAILIPFSIFGPTAFLAEFCISWITGCLLRVLLTASIVGIGFPLFSTGTLALTPGGDPTNYSTGIVALVSVLYVGPRLVGSKQSGVDVWPGRPGAHGLNGRVRAH